MITKEQYAEILDVVMKYTSTYIKVFKDKPMSNEFCAGMQKVTDLIHTLVKKDQLYQSQNYKKLKMLILKNN